MRRAIGGQKTRAAMNCELRATWQLLAFSAACGSTCRVTPTRSHREFRLACSRVVSLSYSWVRSILGLCSSSFTAVFDLERHEIRAWVIGTLQFLFHFLPSLLCLGSCPKMLLQPWPYDRPYDSRDITHAQVAHVKTGQSIKASCIQSWDEEFLTTSHQVII